MKKKYCPSDLGSSGGAARENREGRNHFWRVQQIQAWGPQKCRNYRLSSGTRCGLQQRSQKVCKQCGAHIIIFFVLFPSRMQSISRSPIKILYIFHTCLYLFRISPEGVDIVLDCLCGEECNKGYALLKPMGKYILYGSSNVVTGETKSFFSAARSVCNSALWIN